MDDVTQILSDNLNGDSNDSGDTNVDVNVL